MRLSRTDLVQIDQWLLEPSPEESFTLTCLAMIEQTIHAHVLRSTGVLRTGEQAERS